MILAQAIENEDLNKIKIILENNPELVNLKFYVYSNISSKLQNTYLSNSQSQFSDYVIVPSLTNL